MNEVPEDVTSIAELVSSNARQLVRGYRVDLLVKFLNDIYTRLHNGWKSIQRALIDTINYDRMSEQNKDIIKEWLVRLEPKDIVGRMQKAVHELYASRKLDKITEREEEVVKPFVEEFVRERAYLGEEMRMLLTSKEHISWAFAYNLSMLMPVDQIIPLGDYLLNIICEKEKEYYNHLLVNIYSCLKDNNQALNFVYELYRRGYYSMSIPLMAVTDDCKKQNLKFLLDEIQNGVISDDDVRKYFNATRLRNAIDILELLNILRDKNVSVTLQFDFVSNYWYLDDLYQNQELLSLYKHILLDYPSHNDTQYIYEYSRQLQNVLEKVTDNNFAKFVNKKLIDVLSSHADHNGLDEVYNVLLVKYRSVIWHDFIEALVDIDNRAGFCFQLRYKMGSGFGFGEGSLFRDHYDEMKQVCSDYPKYGPWVCAAMCPVFDEPNPETGEVTSFHPFVIWLFENYGNDKQVLDEFHSNMCTFHWTGSVIPLIEDRRRCLENLKIHPQMSITVKQWAEESLKYNKADHERENQNEAFMRLAYNKK